MPRSETRMPPGWQARNETARPETGAAVRQRRKPRTQAQRTELSDKLLIRAAVKLIAKRGYYRTTLAEIGAEAGYSGGLVSYRFGSKNGLLHALIKQITTRFTRDQLLPAMDGRQGLDALCAFTDTYLGELTAREARLRALYVLMGEALGPVPEIRPILTAMNQDIRAAIENCIKRGIEDGQIRADADPVTEAAACVALLRGVSIQWLVDPKCFDLAMMGERIKDTIRRSLAP